MRKHNLLLSLLALLFAVFMTACDNGTTNDAKQSVDNGGGDQGVIVSPTLSFSYEYLEQYGNVKFTGLLENANEEDYTFTWDFGDGVVSPESSLVIDHAYTSDNGYGVTLTATPKDPEKTPAIASATGIVTISKSGIVIQAFRYSALSGMEYEFQAIATTTDGSPVLYTWDFGDGTVVEDTPQNAMTHRYTKYNTEYTVKVSAKKENAGNAEPLNFPEVKIKTHGVTAQLTIENDTSNARLKRMSVNFYDETGALIHGYSDAEGDVTGLDNVTYTWDFGDKKQPLVTNERFVEYTYDAGGSSNDYTVVVKASSDTFYGEISAKNTTNVTLTYALTKLTATLGGQYGTELTVVAEGNGGESYKGESVIYRVTYPSGNMMTQEVTHDGTTGVGTATFTYDLGKYYDAYNVKVEAMTGVNDEVLAKRETTAEKPSFRYVLNGPNNGDNGYFSKSFNITVAENSFELKGAYFDWITDGATERTYVPNFSHTYGGPGTKTVTVTIGSDELKGTGITVSNLTKTFTINADVTINSLECPNAGAGSNFLQFNCRVYATGTAGTTLNYKWYKNGQAVSGCAGPYCEHTFDTYNRNNYSVKVEVSVQGSNSAPKSQTEPITTPNAQVTITGPAKGIHGQDAVYTATTKVTHNNSTKNITLTNARYNFRLVENTNSSQPQAANKWTFNFRPDDTEYGSNGAVTRTVYAEVTADNLNGQITSNRVATRITKPAASMQSFNQPVITCSPKTGVNQVRQVCKMTVQVKSDAGTIQGQFSDYRAKFMYNNTQKVVNFNSGSITAGATGQTNTFEIDYNWPNNGDITTGASQSQNYIVTGEFYKNGAENDKLTASQANITITLNGDYTLFPQVDKYFYYTQGGSGYKFGTWSCGHNEVRGQNNIGSAGPKCGSGSSVSGQTLNLGNLANNNGTGTLKQTLTFEWRMRINSLGTSLQDTLIKKFVVSANQKPTDENLSFNISKVLRDNNVRYTGSAYGQSNIFYLKIYSDDANVLAKPIKIWYNGSNKTGQGNRLRKITPMMETNGYNSCTIRYAQSGNNLTNKEVTFHVTSARLLFGNFDQNSNIVEFMPNGETYKPFFRFYNKACGGNGVCNSANNDTKATNITTAPGGAEVGWYLNSNAGTVLNNKATITSGLNSGTSTMKLIVKDMLQGSGGAEITDYYPETTCSSAY